MDKSYFIVKKIVPCAAFYTPLINCEKQCAPAEETAGALRKMRNNAQYRTPKNNLLFIAIIISYFTLKTSIGIQKNFIDIFELCLYYKYNFKI